MKRTTLILIALLVAVLSGGLAAAPAAADHEQNDGLGDTLAPHDGSTIDAILGGAAGAVDRARYGVSSMLGDDPSVVESRDDAVKAFNDHSDGFVTYANDRGISDGEVIEVTFENDTDTATAYIVADYDGGAEEYTSAEAVVETDRDVDHEIRLEGMAADNAAAEIERFNEEFVEPDNDVTSSYAGNMAAKYAGLVDEPFTDLEADD